MEKNLLYFMLGNVEMGKFSTQSLVNISNNMDFTKELLQDLSQYEHLYNEILKIKEPQEKLKHISILAKLMLKADIHRSTFKDKSPKKMSEMLIKGFKIGIDDIDENISKAIKLNEKPEIIDLAKEYKKYMVKRMNDYKKYL